MSLETVIEIGSTAILFAGQRAGGTTSCPPGYIVMGGGYSNTALTASGSRLEVSESYPFSITQWRLTFRNLGTEDITITEYAICLKLTTDPAN